MFRLSRASSCLAVLAVVVALFATPTLAPSAVSVVGDCTAAADWGSARADLAGRVVELVNAHRAALGLQTLKVSPTLTGSAVWKARHMAEYRYMTHDDPAPPVARTTADRIAACAYPGRGWGENIAYGYTSPEAVFQAWLSSAGHRANIENASFVAIGVGTAAADTGTLYWAQNFGTLDDSGAVTPPPPSPTPAPVQTATAFPSSTAIETGSLRSGDATRLRADDNAYYEVNASTSARRSSWSARVRSVPNTLRNLRVIYRGRSSASCTQLLSAWNWRTGIWVSLDTRTAGTTEVELALTPAGTPADYVSGTTGSGDVHVRVRCTRTDSASFYSSGDLLKITYEL